MIVWLFYRTRIVFVCVWLLTCTCCITDCCWSIDWLLILLRGCDSMHNICCAMCVYQCWVSLYVVGVRWYTSDAVGRYCHSEYSTDFDDASSTLSSPHEWDDQEDGRSCRKPKEMHYGIPGSHRGGGRADMWNVEPSLYDRRSPNITTTTYDISLTYWRAS